MLKLKTLGARGISHIITPLIVVVIFAVAGVGYLVASHADTPCPTNATACSQPPSVSILTPTVQSTVSGTVLISVRVADPTALAGTAVSVQFETESAKLGTPQTVTPSVNGNTYTYSWNSATVANGSHDVGVNVTPLNPVSAPGILVLGGVSTFIPVTVSNPATACPGTVSTTASTNTCSPLPTPTPVSTASYTLVGKVTPSNSNNTVTAYACVTKLTNTEWATTAFYELASSYKQPTGFNWVATLANTGTTPLAGNKSLSQNFVDDATKPAASINILSNPNGENPLTFSYSTVLNGTTTSSGTIASGIHPVDLKTCASGVPGS